MGNMVTDVTPILQQAFPGGKPELSATEFDKALKFVQGRKLGTVNRPGRNSMDYTFWAHTMIVEWRLLVDEWNKAGKVGLEPKFLLCPECQVMLVADLSAGDILVCGGGCHRAITVNTFVQLFKKPYTPPPPVRSTSQSVARATPASSPRKMGLSQTVPRGQRPEDYGIFEKPKKGVNPLVGWRMWNLEFSSRTAGWRLKAISHEIIWEPYLPMRGTCKNADPANITDHVCPSWEHRCGVHAVKDLPQVKKWGNVTVGNHSTYVRLVGEIDLWGRVLEYEEGFRAEWGYPKKLYLPSRLPEVFEVNGVTAEVLAEELWAAYLTEVVIDDDIISIP